MPWREGGGSWAFDLTEAGGEGFPWASKCGDMGATLVRLAVRHSWAGVGDRVADIAGQAWQWSRRARTAVVGRGKGTSRPA